MIGLKQKQEEAERREGWLWIFHCERRNIRGNSLIIIARKTLITSALIVPLRSDIALEKP